MKKVICLLCFILTLIVIITPAQAADGNASEVVWYEETVLENGVRIVDKIEVDSSARAVRKTATRSRSFYYSDNLIAEIAFQATYYYDGTTVQVDSKSVTQTTTYNGWNYKQNSFTSSGGTVTLDAKLTKLLFWNIEVDMSMTCDVNGNITKG